MEVTEIEGPNDSINSDNSSGRSDNNVCRLQKCNGFKNRHDRRA